MKNLFLVCTFCCCFAMAAKAQDSNLGVSQSVNRLTARSSFIFDETSAYLLKDWPLGKVIYTTNEVVLRPLNYNAFNQQLEFLHQGQPLVFTQPVKEFIVGDTSATHGFLFRNGMLLSPKGDKKLYYQVLLETPAVKVVKHIQYKAREKRNFNEANTSVLFDAYETYYAIPTTSGDFIKMKKSKKDIVALFPDKQAAIDAYLSQHQLKLKDWHEVLEVMQAVGNN